MALLCGGLKGVVAACCLLLFSTTANADATKIPVVDECQTIVETIASQPGNYSMMLSILAEDATATALITDPFAELTIFVPSDDALEASFDLLGMSAADAMQQKDASEQALALLQAHVVPSVHKDLSKLSKPLEAMDNNTLLTFDLDEMTVTPGTSDFLLQALASEFLPVPDLVDDKAEVACKSAVYFIESYVIVPPKLIMSYLGRK